MVELRLIVMIIVLDNSPLGPYNFNVNGRAVTREAKKGNYSFSQGYSSKLIDLRREAKSSKIKSLC